MRRTLVVFTAVAALLIGACSDGDGGSSAEAFCKDYTDLNKDLADVDSSDPEAVAAGFRKLDALKPPEEIADEYHKIVDLAQDAMAALNDIDTNDPEAVAQAQEQFADRQEELQGASEKVQKFLEEKCNIDTASLGGGDG
jgi:hypothetical protein